MGHEGMRRRLRPAFFVFGAERSGSTLLAFMLSGQPGLFVANDTFVFDQLVESQLGGNKPDRRRMMVELAPSLVAEAVRTRRPAPRALWYGARRRWAARLPPDLPLDEQSVKSLYSHLLGRYERPTGSGTPGFLAVYAEVLRLHPRPPAGIRVDEALGWVVAALADRFRPEATMLGEKTPLHTPYADWIMGMYPDARAVLLVRHPVANVTSIARRTGGLRRGVQVFDMYSDVLLRLADDPRLLAVRYEDLVANPAAELGRVVDWVAPGNPFDAACPVNAYTKAAYTGTEVDAGRAERSVLSERDRAAVAGRFRRVIERFYDG